MFSIEKDVLSADITERDIDFIDQEVFEGLSESVKNNFKTAYIERDREINDCYAEVATVTRLTMYAMNSHAEKYFEPFYNAVEELLLQYANK